MPRFRPSSPTESADPIAANLLPEEANLKLCNLSLSSPVVFDIDRLIVFTRYPLPGKAKTRLIPALGAEAAADLQRQMTQHTLAQIKLAQRQKVSLSVEIWFAVGATETAASDQQLMQAWLGSEERYQPQVAGDLGVKLTHAFAAAFQASMSRVVTIGTDCPGVNAALLNQAFQLLKHHDLVLGPATDGGYYLIGLSRLIPELFVEVEWGTAKVLRQTVATATRLNLKTAFLPTLTDIDRPDDLPVWDAVRHNPQLRSRVPALSVIIPVFNEADTIEAVIRNVQTAISSHSEAEPVEILVVDGSSQDNTVAIARSMGVLVMSSLPGRASQMNAGAKIATGETLLFLHADTRLPAQFNDLVRQALAKPHTIAGAFELQISASQQVLGLRLVEWGVKCRSRLLQLPYGDQAIFLKAETFHQLGGFPELPLMEDFELVRQLRKWGKIAIVPVAVQTSNRRWQKLGVLKTTLINQAIVISYLLGVSPDRLARWYRGKYWGKAR